MEPYQLLEKAWAEFNDLDPNGMVVCSSGTSALHLALEAPRIQQGSTVAIPDFTMVACPRAAALAGLLPVFIDCDERLLVSPELLPESPACDVVMPVHVYGRRCDMDRIAEYCDRHTSYLVEDAAEAHGVRPHQRTDAYCVSFFKNKIVAGEEGGAVWFRDPAHAELARSLRTLGFTAAHDYTHIPRGHNYRMSNLHARFILDDFGQGPFNPNALRYAHPFTTWAPQKDHPGNATLRRRIEGWYDTACPAEWRMPARDAVWVYDIRLPDVFETHNDRAREQMMGLVRRLQDAGIAARPGFWPMHLQEEFRRCRYAWRDAAHSIRAARTVLYLPVQPGRTTEADCRRAFDILTEALPPSR